MMDEQQIDASLSRAEAQMAAEHELDLSQLRFWTVIATLKARPELASTYADRVAAIDRYAFRAWAGPTLAIPIGAALLAIVAIGGLMVIALAYRLPAPWNGFFVLGGTGALLGTTHGLTHLAVGRVVGIRFTHWFLDGPTRVQPGIKIDYGTYLRTGARARAWMHASGAIVTKLVPFAMVGAAWAADTPAWTAALLIGVGVTQIITDALFSTKQSDWKKFLREMRFA